MHTSTLSLTSGFLLAFLGTGCATTLSSFQTAEPIERGHVQVVTGAGFYVPVGASLNVVDQGKDLADKLKNRAFEGEAVEYTSEERDTLLAAGIALAVLPPSPSYEIGIRTGVTEDLDVGFRYSVNAVRVDTKYRFFHRGNLPPPAAPPQEQGGQPNPAPPRASTGERSTDVAIGFGVSKYLFSNPVFDVLDYVDLGSFSRWDFEVPLYASHRIGEVLKVYGGPRWLYSRINIDTQLRELTGGGQPGGVDLEIPTLVHMHFIGATAGLAVGYKYVHVMLELTGGYTRARPVLLGEQRNIGGATFYPAVGLALSF